MIHSQCLNQLWSTLCLRTVGEFGGGGRGAGGGGGVHDRVHDSVRVTCSHVSHCSRGPWFVIHLM